MEATSVSMRFYGNTSTCRKFDMRPPVLRQLEQAGMPCLTLDSKTGKNLLRSLGDKLWEWKAHPLTMSWTVADYWLGRILWLNILYIIYIYIYNFVVWQGASSQQPNCSPASFAFFFSSLIGLGFRSLLMWPPGPPRVFVSCCQKKKSPWLNYSPINGWFQN